jgi:hypothetical protein
MTRRAVHPRSEVGLTRADLLRIAMVALLARRGAALPKRKRATAGKQLGLELEG